jgi:hypothetical protein
VRARAWNAPGSNLTKHSEDLLFRAADSGSTRSSIAIDEDSEKCDPRASSHSIEWLFERFDEVKRSNLIFVPDTSAARCSRLLQRKRKSQPIRRHLKSLPDASSAARLGSGLTIGLRRTIIELLLVRATGLDPHEVTLNGF